MADDCFKDSTCLGVKLGSERCIPTELDSDAGVKLYSERCMPTELDSEQGEHCSPPPEL